MPRININEKDRTSPGTPGGYSNNTVLIAGFSTRTNEEIIEAMDADPALGYILPDDNGIFEFESVGDFEKTIGLVAPTVYVTDDEEDILDDELPVHYGNQMAYELLKMGYPIIYINLGVPGRTTVETDEGEIVTLDAAALMKKLGQESTWEIFKDRASYDFRFVSHGLLTSGKFAKSDDLIKLEARVAKMTELFNEFNAEFKPQQIEEEVEGEDAEGNPTTEKITREETLDEIKERIYNKVKESEEKYITGDDTKVEAEAIGYTTTLLAAADSYDAAAEYIAEQKTLADEKLEEEGFNSEAFSDADFADANAAIAKLAHYRTREGNEDEMDATSGRGDCIALIEVDESQYITKAAGKRPENQIIDAINAMADINADNGKYCACAVPSVVYKMTADERFNSNKKFPGAFHYLACFKNSLGLGFAEWYAAAGYTRGVSSYVIDHTTVKLGEVAIQALEPRNIENQSEQPKFAVNVIANFRGSYYLWGNRTCHPLGDAMGGNDLVASHFLNIRQLCTTIKKQLYVSCRRFTFDPNSDVLWINFKNSITPMLDRMKADQGVRDYKIEKVYTDKKATLKARIRIVPIEAVEDFLLEVSLEDSLGETAVTIAE